MRQAVYERNLACLAASDPGLAARLERADAEKAARCTLSKTQKTVLTLDTEKGPRALHSLFDPEKEGRRLLETFPPEGFFVFLGFGCAYHIRPCMEKPEISRIVIVDRNIGLLKAVLGEVDVQDLLMDPRVRFLIDPKPEELRAFILEEYSPALAGDMRTVTLRPRVEQEKDFFGAAHTVIKESLQEISGDFSVQSLFGKKWFTNTLANLRAAETSCAAPASREKAIVTGAGPSLEDGIPAIRRARTESFLIATDTSLPVLLYHDLCPDMVISIDCQHIGYNHFMAGYPREVPLVLDLASPAVIRRLAPRVIFFTSGHPFSRYINSRWRRFPFIDTSGGNVTHAAVSLADSLGAREIHLYGADFSCPEGKSYAREAYAYPYFRCRETRLAGIESLFTHFLFRTTSTRAVWHGREVRYANASLAQYKERLESSSRGLRARLVPVPGKGETLRIAAPAGDKEPPAIFAASARRGSWKEFLAAYGAGIAKLPAPGSPIISYLRGLSPEERDIVTTLLPAAAVFVRAARKEKIPAPRLLYLARSWTREELEKTLVRG